MAGIEGLSIENIAPRITIDEHSGSLESTRKMVEERARKEMYGADSSISIPDGNFGGLLSNALDQVNRYQVDADSAIKNLVAGRTKNVHETMLVVERADMSLKLMMQIRNKILDAYREIMRMQV